LIMDEASTDGTREMVTRDFPEVELYSSPSSMGPTAQRNRGTALATTPIVVSIDDDCEFVEPRTLQRAIADFANQRVGLISIPYIDFSTSRDVQGGAPAGSEPYASSNFRGCAYAVRRDIYLAAGGYREVLFMDSEEDDLAIRILNLGYIVLAGQAPAVHHHASPRRDLEKVDVLGARNLILFAWFNVPRVYLVPHLVATTLNSLVFGLRTRTLRRKI